MSFFISGSVFLFGFDSFGRVDPHGAACGPPEGDHNTDGYDCCGDNFADKDRRPAFVEIFADVGVEGPDAGGSYDGGREQQYHTLRDDAGEDLAPRGTAHLPDGDLADPLLHSEPEGAEQPEEDSRQHEEHDGQLGID